MWTAERDAELLRRWKSQSTSEIGRAMGVTRNAVIGRYHRIAGTYAAQEAERAKAEKRENAIRRKQALKREREALDLMKKRIAEGWERDAAICLAIEEGARQVAIAAQFDVSRQRISQIMLS